MIHTQNSKIQFLFLNTTFQQSNLVNLISQSQNIGRANFTSSDGVQYLSRIDSSVEFCVKVHKKLIWFELSTINAS